MAEDGGRAIKRWTGPWLPPSPKKAWSPSALNTVSQWKPLIRQRSPTLKPPFAGSEKRYEIWSRSLPYCPGGLLGGRTTGFPHRNTQRKRLPVPGEADETDFRESPGGCQHGRYSGLYSPGIGGRSRHSRETFGSHPLVRGKHLRKKGTLAPGFTPLPPIPRNRPLPLHQLFTTPFSRRKGRLCPPTRFHGHTMRDKNPGKHSTHLLPLQPLAPGSGQTTNTLSE
mgnify:FL=1